jgi:hypothetical protein
MCALVTTIGFQAIADTLVTGRAFKYAFRHALQDPGGALVMLVPPYFVIAYLARRAARRTNQLVGWLVFLPPVAILGWYYYWGHIGAEKALLDQMWTAAALSVGLLPFFVGIPVVLGAGVLGELLAWAWDKFRPNARRS